MTHLSSLQPEPTIVRSVRLRQSLVEPIAAMAKEQNRNFSNMVETLLLKAKEHGIIEEPAEQE